jgi:hypothetical protein
MLRRYDEVITTKANKHGLYAEVDKINKTYEPLLKEVKAEAKTNKKMMAKLKDDMNRVEIDVETRTLNVLNHFMRERSRIDKECREDPYKLEQDNPALFKALEQKADKEEVGALDSKKSNRTELATMTG